MKKQFLAILAVLFLASTLAAQTAAKKDSAAAPATKNAIAPAAAQPKSSDEELILDDGNKPAPQAEKKTAAAPLVDTARKAAAIRAAAADTGAAKKAAAPQAVAKPQPSQPPVSSKDTVKKASDEELILEGGAEDLLGQEKATEKKGTQQAKAAAPVVTDTSSAKHSPDSGAAAAASPKDTGAKAVAATSPAAPVISTVPVVPEKIEKIRSINFAANLKDYRSPKLAMLMSLLVPGSGQFYAKSNWVAAACLAVEAALIGTGYAFVKQSQDQKKKARSYADGHYSAGNFSKYDSTLYAFLTKDNKAKGDSIYYDIIYFGDSTAVQNFKNEAGRKTDIYYDNISSTSSPFVRGWDDAAPTFSGDVGINPAGADTALYGAFTGDSAYFAYKKKPGKYPAYGFSQDQLKYNDMISQSQGLARTGNGFYMSLLVNHLASAVIAGILAKKHNDELLGKDSFWRRVDVKEQMVNTGTTTVTGYALAVSF